MTIYRVLYVSRNLILGSSAEVECEIRRVLDVSRNRNDAAGVTGALLFNKGCFAQVLEGEYLPVEQTFDRIQMDERHGAVIPLQFEAVGERCFANWSMAYIGTAQADAARFGDLAGHSGFDPTRLDGQGIFRSMLKLVLNQEQGAAG